MKETGLIHMYYGDGKGKTTAAMGQAIRAAGYGYRVLIAQFMKDNNSSERAVLEAIPHITCLKGRVEEKFTFQMNEKELEEAKEYNETRFASIKKQVGNYQVLLLDEILYAMRAGLIKEEAILDFLEKKPPQLEVIMTGNGMSNQILRISDYVTEMKMIKHPYSKGQESRKGIEQ